MSRFYIHPTAKIGGLANKQVQDLTAALSNMTIENDLRRRIRDNIKRLRDMGSYRGRRHAMSLPVRGQRTRTQVWKREQSGAPQRHVDLIADSLKLDHYGTAFESH